MTGVRMCFRYIESCVGGPSAVTRVFVQEVAREPASVPAQAVGDLDAVTKVATPEELQQAVMEGVRHIEVIAHMDLTSLDEAFYPDGFLLGVFSDATRSIRVCVQVLRPVSPLCNVVPNTLSIMCLPFLTRLASTTALTITYTMTPQPSLMQPLLFASSRGTRSEQAE